MPYIYSTQTKLSSTTRRGLNDEMDEEMDCFNLDLSVSISIIRHARQFFRSYSGSLAAVFLRSVHFFRLFHFTEKSSGDFSHAEVVNGAKNRAGLNCDFFQTSFKMMREYGIRTNYWFLRGCFSLAI